MEAFLKEIIWQQFGASIDMLENALAACPDKLWNTPEKFWYNAYHTLFWLDYYLSVDPKNFSPPAPFTLSEFDAGAALPEPAYSKTALLAYLAFGRKKCRDLIAGLPPDDTHLRFINDKKNYSITEILLYNMRHVQHHAAQLNLLLRQAGYEPPHWVSRTKESIEY